MLHSIFVIWTCITFKNLIVSLRSIYTYARTREALNIANALAISNEPTNIQKAIKFKSHFEFQRAQTSKAQISDSRGNLQNNFYKISCTEHNANNKKCVSEAAF